MNADNKLNATVIPIDIAWADRDENLYAVERRLPALPVGTDMVILPELFSTGFIDDANMAEKLAETLSGTTITTLRRWAKETNAAFVGSYLARTGKSLYNRGFIIEPSGEETYYDKRHLFSLGNEPAVLTKGLNTLPIVRFRGWNIALAICYDLRFPVWCRNRNNAYDLLVVPANWPQSREYAWRQLLIARAIENQAFVVGCNRSGRDDHGQYDNMSHILDFSGKDIGTAARDGSVTATMQKSQLDTARKKFPVSADADEFAISL